MATFLDLPLELRQNIYSLALAAQQLKAQAFLDRAWDLAEKPAEIPALLFVNKRVSEEAAAVFYSRAVLNVAPLRPPAFLFDSLHGNSPKLNLAFGLDVQFAPFPRAYLARIALVRVFSGHRDAVNAEAYEALLRWLVDNTAARDIHLSYRLMTRLRTARTNVAAISALYEAAPNLSLRRTIHVYGHGVRSQWELTRMAEISHALRGATLPKVQAYVLEQGVGHDPLLDPRWDLRKSSTAEEVDSLHRVSTWLDHLLATDAVAKQAVGDRAESDIGPGLYQICFVFARGAPTAT
jgi:hypothetical protein